VAVGVFLGGTAVLPMALMSVCLHRTIGGLDPRLIVGGLAATWRVYPLALLVMIILYSAATALQFVPQVGIVISSFLSLWLILVEMRILGVLYRTHAEDLDWM